MCCVCNILPVEYKLQVSLQSQCQLTLGRHRLHNQSFFASKHPQNTGMSIPNLRLSLACVSLLGHVRVSRGENAMKMERFGHISSHPPAGRSVGRAGGAKGSVCSGTLQQVLCDKLRTTFQTKPLSMTVNSKQLQISAVLTPSNTGYCNKMGTQGWCTCGHGQHTCSKQLPLGYLARPLPLSHLNRALVRYFRYF